MFSEGQTLTSGAVSENIVCVGPGDIGQGNNISLFVSVEGAPETAMVVTLETASKSDMSDAATQNPTYPASAKAVKAGGVVVDTRLPTGCKKYLRLKYGGVAGGKVTAGLVKDV